MRSQVLRRWILVAASLLLLTACPPKKPPIEGHPPTAERLAKELADKIAPAQTDEARFNALLDVMRALNVGVYTPSGDPLLRGAERSPRDFFLYDFELTMMARSMSRQQLWSVPDLAMLLTHMGIQQDGRPLEPETLRRALLSGTTAAAQSPGNRLALAPLLVRELGLRQVTPYDTFENVPLETLRFNALQSWLILADTTIPTVQKVGPIAGASNLRTASQGVTQVAATSLSDKCEEIGKVVKEGWSFGEWVLPFIPKVGGIVNTAIAIPVVDGIHGSILAYGVEVKELDQRVGPTHYGHEQPGQELRFRIRVRMLDELSDIDVKCGWLVGVEFPKQGPLADIKIMWMNEDGDLEKHGKLECDDLVCITLTDADGIATLVFKPKQEKRPFGQGLQKEETGIITGNALYLTKFNNTLGAVNQVISPKLASIRWFVAFHEPDHWSGEGTMQAEVNYDNVPNIADLTPIHRSAISGPFSITFRVQESDTILGEGTATLTMTNETLTIYPEGGPGPNRHCIQSAQGTVPITVSGKKEDNQLKLMLDGTQEVPITHTCTGVGAGTWQTTGSLLATTFEPLIVAAEDGATGQHVYDLAAGMPSGTPRPNKATVTWNIRIKDLKQEEGRL
jgi:hypothetical protein